MWEHTYDVGLNLLMPGNLGHRAAEIVSTDTQPNYDKAEIRTQIARPTLSTRQTPLDSNFVGPLSVAEDPDDLASYLGKNSYSPE